MSPYRTPLALWLTSVAGLVVMLLSDGAGDVAGLALVSLPLVAFVRALREGKP